ncbi:thioredoxin domain-containing protein [Cellulomonas sp. zg-ZUI222]|uniref:Thioredoxin domain-containing protein n=1 Tax=Cellulomonas wangleii TaxID=2816956 RepID=A0ABX8D5B8_9CELL|nr:MULTISPECIES: thioredoxin domain-containing protein [Cellulomonas]MBO0901990.1 thioredoxin domain-containing protein [Cellulomonas sp. zg-ZUI22]MBO0922846.1 thioredoxin domain-containing protein [Cellulomonas wangleii]MBO0925248.1 thioredoxin domain-containing protein [Cellulomonas wangleii]QVI61247.1 thioredoxin domain-containing protein [Cellulomonas wangleii]
MTSPEPVVVSTDPDRHVLGDPDAPVTVVEYGDLECPYCRDAEPVLRRLVEESGGRVRLVWRHFPLFQVHPHALAAALAAEAAGAHGRFWEMQRLLFAHQDALSDEDLGRYAQEVGLAPDELVGPPADRFARAVQADYEGGIELDVPGTPTLLIDGVRYRGRVELEALRQVVDAV